MRSISKYCFANVESFYLSKQFIFSPHKPCFWPEINPESIRMNPEWVSTKRGLPEARSLGPELGRLSTKAVQAFEWRHGAILFCRLSSRISKNFPQSHIEKLSVLPCEQVYINPQPPHFSNPSEKRSESSSFKWFRAFFESPQSKFMLVEFS